MSKTIIPSYQVAELIRPHVSVPVYTGSLVAGQEDRIITRDIGGDVNPKYLRDTNLVQVITMANDYQTGYNLMRTVVDSVVGHSSVDQSDIVYIRFVMINGPNYIGPDDTELDRFTMTLELTSEPKSSSLSEREPID